MRTAKSRSAVVAAAAGGLLGLAIALVAVPAFSKPGVAAPTITSKPAAVTASTTASFAFTGPSGATFRCSRDGVAFSSCTSPVSYSGIPDGTHSFQVKAVVGADESSPASYSWAVDTVPPPTPAITGRPNAISNDTTPVFAFTDSDRTAGFRCSVDNGPATACSSPTSYAGLPQGDHQFRVQAVDAAGNTSQASTWSWTLDSVAPTAPTLTTKPTDPTPNATNKFAWTGAEDGLTYQCSFENGAWSSCSTPYTWVLQVSNYGQHQFAVRAVDAAGNASGATAYSFKYQKGLPSSGVPFQISGTVSGLTLGLWRPISVTITNPNNVTIFVSSLRVDVAADSTPGGCDSATNVELEQSNLSSALPVAVPANGSVVLPAQGVAAPRIRLKNLPTVNQDVCKGKTFALSYSGSATN